MKLIGVGGTDASGKDSLGQILSEYHGWLFITVTDLLREEANKRGLPMKRESYRQVSAQWRRENGMAVLIDRAIKEFTAQTGEYSGLVIASLRHPAEADRIHELGGKVVWTDADPKLRYERISVRNRGAEDQVSFEEFLAEERTQMQHSGDEATLNLSGVKERADFIIENNDNDIKNFRKLVEKTLGL